MAANDANRFRAFAVSSLTRNGYDAATASRFSVIYGYAYLFISSQDVISAYGYMDKAATAYGSYDGVARFAQATRLMNNAQEYGMSSEILLQGFQDVRLVGAAGVLSGLVTLLDVVAKAHHVALNECMMSVSKVSLDAAGIAGGGLSAETGFGAVLAAMSVLAFANDAKDLRNNCF